MCLNLPFQGPLLPLIQGVSSAVSGGLAEGYLLLGVSVQMALQAVAMAPTDSERLGRWLVTCGADGRIHQFCASRALPADRPYWFRLCARSASLTVSM
jgi:hypothetical protein